MKPPNLIEQIELFKRCVTEMLVIRDTTHLTWNQKFGLLSSDYFVETLKSTGLTETEEIAQLKGIEGIEKYVLAYVSAFEKCAAIYESILPELNEAFNPKAEPKPRTLREGY